MWFPEQVMSNDLCIALGQKSLGTCWDLKLTLIQVLRGVAIVDIAPWKRCWTCFLWVNVLVDLHGCSNLNELLLPTELVSMIEGSKSKEYNGLVSSQLSDSVHMTSQHFLSESLCLQYEYTDIWLGTIGATHQHPPPKKKGQTPNGAKEDRVRCAKAIQDGSSSPVFRQVKDLHSLKLTLRTWKLAIPKV